MDNKNYTKLSNLIDSNFTVESVGEYVYKRWDPAQMKMLVSQDWQEGYRKIYPVTTDKGLLDMGSGQLGTLLEACFYGGKSDLVGKTFSVKSNGKMGMDIRYFFNPLKTKPIQDSEQIPIDEVPPEFQ